MVYITCGVDSHFSLVVVVVVVVVLLIEIRITLPLLLHNDGESVVNLSNT